MAENTKWEDGLFLFDTKALKNRGIDKSTIVLPELRRVSVTAGMQYHESFKGYINIPEKKLRGYPANELHVAKTKSTYLQSKFKRVETLKTDGEVRLLYLGASTSSKRFTCEIEMSKLEALQLARALIAAAESIEARE